MTNKNEKRKTQPIPAGIPGPAVTSEAAALAAAGVREQTDERNLIEAGLTLHGMHCDSCGKIIERTVLKYEGACIRSFDTVNNRIVLACRSDEQLGEIRKTLLAKGYQTLRPRTGSLNTQSVPSLSFLWDRLSCTKQSSTGSPGSLPPTGVSRSSQPFLSLPFSLLTVTRTRSGNDCPVWPG